MRKTTRLGAILIVMAASLAVTLVLRANMPRGSTVLATLNSEEYRVIEEGIWSPVNLWITFSVDKEVNLYILDEEGLALWRGSGQIRSLLSLTNVSSVSQIFDVPQRGIYAILIHNPNNSRLMVTVNLTFYGFEKDLSQCVIVFIILGGIVLSLSLLSVRSGSGKEALVA